MADTNTYQAQANELSQKLWAIANELRGQMDASEFKNYILGVIFYRYLSERTEMYMAEILENDGVTYEEAFADDDYRPVVEDWSLSKLGYVIKPENLFRNLIRKITKFENDADKFSVEDFEKAINDLVGSTMGHESNKAFDGLFNDMRLQDARLGETVADRTDMIGRVMVKVSDIDFDLQDSQFDVLGTAYMILIGLFASDAGKKGGEFFTPAGPSRLCATLASLGLDEAKTVGDCTCGSASMLLEVQKHLTTHKVGHFYGQEQKNQMIHVIQSFSKKEFNPDDPNDLQMANHLGVEFAQLHYPGRQVAVFTQIDGKAGCVHNHIAVNNVSMEDYRACDKEQYYHPTIKKWTDKITEKYTVRDTGIKNPEKLTQSEKSLREKGEYSWKDDLRERIKKSLKECESADEFFEKLQSNGVGIEHKQSKRKTAKHTDFYVYDLQDLSNVPDGEKAPKHTKVRSYNMGHLYDVDGVQEYFDLKESAKLKAAEEQVQSVVVPQEDEEEPEAKPKKKWKKPLRFKEYLKAQGYEFYTNENGDIYKFGEGLDYKTLVDEYDEYLMQPPEEETEDEEVVVEELDSVKEKEQEIPEEENVPEKDAVQEEPVTEQTVPEPVEQVVEEVQPDAETVRRMNEENERRLEQIRQDKIRAESTLPGRIFGNKNANSSRRRPLPQGGSYIPKGDSYDREK